MESSKAIKPKGLRPKGGYRTGRAKLYSGEGSSSALTPSDVNRLTCPKCEVILREPQQLTTCGCRYCAVCIEQTTSGDR